MVSSLIFGETCTLLQQDSDWLYVACNHDNYEGWIPENYLFRLSETDEIWTRILGNQSAFISDGISRIHLSAGSVLPQTNQLVCYGREFYLTIRDPLVPGSLFDLAKGFLYVPYLWGGRSDCGIDCSGLTQVVCRIGGIDLPRDASQQYEFGTQVNWEDRKPDDLVYFGTEDKITHVGILGPEDRIVHASGHVREDSLGKAGIVPDGHKQISHYLVGIKRLDRIGS